MNKFYAQKDIKTVNIHYIMFPELLIRIRLLIFICTHMLNIH